MIVRKIRFHQHHPEYEDYWSPDQVDAKDTSGELGDTPTPKRLPDHDGSDEPRTLQVISRLLVVQNSILTTMSQAFVLLEKGAKDAGPCTRSALLPLMAESYLTYIATTRVLLTVSEKYTKSQSTLRRGKSSIRPDQLVALSHQYELDLKAMQKLYKQADEVEEVSIMKQTPRLPAVSPLSEGGAKQFREMSRKSSGRSTFGRASSKMEALKTLQDEERKYIGSNNSQRSPGALFGSEDDDDSNDDSAFNQSRSPGEHGTSTGRDGNSSSGSEDDDDDSSSDSGNDEDEDPDDSTSGGTGDDRGSQACSISSKGGLLAASEASPSASGAAGGDSHWRAGSLRGGDSAKSGGSDDDDGNDSGAWESGSDDGSSADGGRGGDGEPELDRRDSTSREQAKDLRLDLQDETGEWSNYCTWQGPNSRAPSSGQARETSFGVKRPSDGGVGPQHKAWASGAGSNVLIVDSSSGSTGTSLAMGGVGESGGGGGGAVTGFPHHPSPLTPSPQAVSSSAAGRAAGGNGGAGNSYANAAPDEGRRRRSSGTSINVGGGGSGGGNGGSGGVDSSGDRSHRGGGGAGDRNRRNASPPPGAAVPAAAVPLGTSGVSSAPASGASQPSRSGGAGSGDTGIRGDGSDPHSPPPKPPDQLQRSRRGGGGGEGGGGRGGEELPVEMPGLGLARPTSASRGELRQEPVGNVLSDFDTLALGGSSRTVSTQGQDLSVKGQPREGPLSLRRERSHPPPLPPRRDAYYDASGALVANPGAADGTGAVVVAGDMSGTASPPPLPPRHTSVLTENAAVVSGTSGPSRHCSPPPPQGISMPPFLGGGMRERSVSAAAPGSSSGVFGGGISGSGGMTPSVSTGALSGAVSGSMACAGAGRPVSARRRDIRDNSRPVVPGDPHHLSGSTPSQPSPRLIKGGFGPSAPQAWTGAAVAEANASITALSPANRKWPPGGSASGVLKVGNTGVSSSNHVPTAGGGAGSTGSGGVGASGGIGGPGHSRGGSASIGGAGTGERMVHGGVATADHKTPGRTRGGVTGNSAAASGGSSSIAGLATPQQRRHHRAASSGVVPSAVPSAVPRAATSASPSSSNRRSTRLTAVAGGGAGNPSGTTAGVVGGGAGGGPRTSAGGSGAAASGGATSGWSGAAAGSAETAGAGSTSTAETGTSAAATASGGTGAAAAPVAVGGGTGRVVIAKYEYTAQGPEQLSFRVGDTVQLHTEKVNAKGWGLGQANGKVGWFPGDFVDMRPTSAEGKSRVSAGNVRPASSRNRRSHAPSSGNTAASAAAGGAGAAAGTGGSSAQRQGQAAAGAPPPPPYPGRHQRTREGSAGVGAGGRGRGGGAAAAAAVAAGGEGSESAAAGYGTPQAGQAAERERVKGNDTPSKEPEQLPEHVFAIQMAKNQPWRDRLTPGGKVAYDDLLAFFKASRMVLDFDEIELKSVIGSGAFATVFLGIYRYKVGQRGEGDKKMRISPRVPACVVNMLAALPKQRLSPTEVVQTAWPNGASPAHLTEPTVIYDQQYEEALQDARTEEVAVKKLVGGGGGPMEKTLKDFKTECVLLSRLKHRNIIALVGATTHPVTCVMQYCSRGNLMVLLDDRSVDLSWKMKKQMMLDVAAGMQYLHCQNPVIIHRDLKSLNVLIDENWVTKVTDFGLSRFKATSVSEKMTGQAGTYHWMAPEVINSQHYTEKADVFSYGIILWEIFTRAIPYGGMQPVQVVAAVLGRKERPRIPSKCPQALSQLMQACWAHDPDQRPCFDDVVPWLESL